PPHAPDKPRIDNLDVRGWDEQHRPKTRRLAFYRIARHEPAGMGTPAAELPPARDAVAPVHRARGPHGPAGTGHQADRLLTTHGPSHVPSDPAPDDRIRGAAPARIPADRAINGGEFLDDLQPGRPRPFLAPGTAGDQCAEETESGHRFHHRWRQLARL